MRIINRYILRQIAVPSLMALSVVTVVAVAAQLQKQLLELPIDQLTLPDMCRLMFYFIPPLLAYVLFVMYMMGILLAFGRLAQRNEIVAMQAAGIPLKRVIFPVILGGAVLSVFCLWVQDRAQPWAIHRVIQFVYNDLPTRLDLASLAPGTMHEFGDWRIYMGNRDETTGAMTDVVILKPDPSTGGAEVYHADTAELRRQDGRMLLHMPQGYCIRSAEGERVAPWRFQGMTLALPRLEGQPIPEIRATMTIRQLYERRGTYLDEFKQTGSELKRRELERDQGEIAERLSLPFACLAVALVAAPLGARAKRAGRSYTFSVGFAILLTYYVLKLLAEPKDLMPLPLAVALAWIPNVLLCAGGAALIWRVDRV